MDWQKIDQKKYNCTISSERTNKAIDIELFGLNCSDVEVRNSSERSKSSMNSMNDFCGFCDRISRFAEKRNLKGQLSFRHFLDILKAETDLKDLKLEF